MTCVDALLDTKTQDGREKQRRGEAQTINFYHDRKDYISDKTPKTHAYTDRQTDQTHTPKTCHLFTVHEADFTCRKQDLEGPNALSLHP